MSQSSSDTPQTSLRRPIEYMQRSRDYYAAQGFSSYKWARNDEIPWQIPTKPLAASRIGIVTTAVPDRDTPKPIRTAKAWPMDAVPAQFYTDELSWDKVTTHTDDRASYFPLEALNTLSASGKVGDLSSRYYFVPTEYSQRNTREKDAPQVVADCLDDGVDIALLVPL